MKEHGEGWQTSFRTSRDARRFFSFDAAERFRVKNLAFDFSSFFLGAGVGTSLDITGGETGSATGSEGNEAAKGFVFAGGEKMDTGVS